jgi:3-vinyl bacteriochlorophyllide hydratase
LEAEPLQDAGQRAMLARRAQSMWTKIHPIFAIGQLMVFFVSVGLLIAYFRGALDFSVVHVSVLVKIGLMVGAVITGSLWEHDVFGHWWFAPEFFVEDAMTAFVFVTQIAYLTVHALYPANQNLITQILIVAYVVYLCNVAQYIHRWQRMKQERERLKNVRPAA